MLARFMGSWTLAPVVDPLTGAIIGCSGVLEQDVLPAGECREVVLHFRIG